MARVLSTQTEPFHTHTHTQKQQKNREMKCWCIPSVTRWHYWEVDLYGTCPVWLGQPPWQHPHLHLSAVTPEQSASPALPPAAKNTKIKVCALFSGTHLLTHQHQTNESWMNEWMEIYVPWIKTFHTKDCMFTEQVTVNGNIQILMATESLHSIHFSHCSAVLHRFRTHRTNFFW